MIETNIKELTASIVAAHVGHNDTKIAELPTLIRDVHADLSGLGVQVEPPAPEQQAPAVSIRASVKPDHVTCLDCGAKMKMLKRHLMTDHGIGPEEYRARWSLPSNHPLVAPNYAARRRELALEIGLGRKADVRKGI